MSTATVITLLDSVSHCDKQKYRLFLWYHYSRMDLICAICILVSRNIALCGANLNCNMSSFFFPAICRFSSFGKGPYHLTSFLAVCSVRTKTTNYTESAERYVFAYSVYFEKIISLSRCGRV